MRVLTSEEAVEAFILARSSICPENSIPRGQAYFVARAQSRGIHIDQLVNELLRKEIELIKTVR